MNYLAHIFLSGDNDLLKIGNFLGDFVRSKDQKNYHPQIQKGINLHRYIDHYTDTHAIVKKSKIFLKKTKSFKVYFESSKTPLFLECKNFVSDISTKKSKIDSAILARDITSIVSKIKKQ